MVYSTRWFVLCSSLCYLVLVFFSPFSIAITSLGEERANLSAFRTCVRFVLVWFCRFPLSLGVWEGLRFVIVALPGLFSYLFLVCSVWNWADWGVQWSVYWCSLQNFGKWGPSTWEVSPAYERHSRFKWRCYKMMKGLNPSKALRPDELHPRVLKEIAVKLGPVFAHLFQQSLDKGEIPKERSLANFCSLYKSGDRALQSHYCPVALVWIDSSLCNW